MAFDDIWRTVNVGLNFDVFGETQPFIWLAFALPGDIISIRDGESSFWTQQWGFQKVTMRLC